MPSRLDATAPGFEAAFRGLVEARREERADVREAVAAILADVAVEGDAALLRYTERFDRLTLTPERLRVSPEEIAAAKARCPAAQLEALALAAERIRVFHARQVPVVRVDPDRVIVQILDIARNVATGAPAMDQDALVTLMRAAGWKVDLTRPPGTTPTR